MKEYIFSHRNLPADVLVLKEIARQILSAKQYGRFRKYRLIVSTRKRAGAGTYNKTRRQITIGIQGRFIEWDIYNNAIHEHISLTNDTAISVFIHELAHLVQYNNGNVKPKTRYHNKTFHKILNRLNDNYKKIDLPSVIEQCNKTAQEFIDTKNKKTEKQKNQEIKKNSIEHKLELTRKRIKSWETKQKRAETYLKKLRRREKIYVRRMDS